MWVFIIFAIFMIRACALQEQGWSTLEIWAPNDPVMFFFWIFAIFLIWVCFIGTKGKKK